MEIGHNSRSWLGLRMLRSKGGFQLPDADSAASVTAGESRRIFFKSFLVAVTNPKGYIFCSALLPQFIDPAAAQAPQYLVIALIFAGLDTLVMLGYAFVGARLASGKITYEQVGPSLETKVVSLPYQKPARDGGVLLGTIPLIDFHYGNVWTNVPDTLFEALTPAPKFGDKFAVTILHDGKEVYRGVMPYARTFGDVPEGAPLLYLNSLLNVAFALNMGSFSEKHGLASGGTWTVRVERAK